MEIWKEYDVVIEDISRVNNSRAQFNLALAKSPHEDLVNGMREKPSARLRQKTKVFGRRRMCIIRCRRAVGATVNSALRGQFGAAPVGIRRALEIAADETREKGDTCEDDTFSVIAFV